MVSIDGSLPLGKHVAYHLGKRVYPCVNTAKQVGKGLCSNLFLGEYVVYLNVNTHSTTVPRVNTTL